MARNLTSKASQYRAIGRPAWIVAKSIVSVALISVLLVACRVEFPQAEIPPGQGAALIKDKVRYAGVDSLIISYVDYPIFNIRLLLSPDPKTAFQDAIILPSVFPEVGTKWGGKRFSDGGPGEIAWDRTWPVTKKYTIWWQRVVDPVAFAGSRNYDRYTTRATEPGTAWCEAVVTLNKPLPAISGHFVLLFFPDGHVEAGVSAMLHDPSHYPPYRHLDNAEDPRHSEQEQGILKALVGAACIKEIPNPYFGTERPIQMY